MKPATRVTWVEKVNWTKLQIRDFIAIYAKECDRGQFFVTFRIVYKA